MPPHCLHGLFKIHWRVIWCPPWSDFNCLPMLVSPFSFFCIRVSVLLDAPLYHPHASVYSFTSFLRKHFSIFFLTGLLPVQDAVHSLLHRNTNSLFTFLFNPVFNFVTYLLMYAFQNHFPPEKSTVYSKLIWLVEILFYSVLFTVEEPSSTLCKRKGKYAPGKVLDLQTSPHSFWEERGVISRRTWFSFIKVHHIISYLAQWHYWHF